jgi:hypothetical protein
MTTTTAAPAEGWILVARRKLMADKIVYSAGCAIEPAALGRNLSALLRTGLVVWLPPGSPISVLPVEAPTQPEAKRRPRVVILDVRDDPVASWLKTKERMIQKCDGDAQMARDILDSDERSRDLYRMACRVGCAAEAARRGVVSVSPDSIGL